MTLDDLRSAVNHTVGEIAIDPDPLARYRAATELGALGQVVVSAAAQLRGAALIQLRDQHGLSIAEIAHAVGVSKSRAAQLIEGVEGDPAATRP